jgi:hypothetical protein
MSYMSTTGTALHSLAVETDTRLADLHRQGAEIRQTITSHANTIKQYAGAERNRWGLYKMTLDEAEAIIATEGWKPRGPVASWGRPGGTIDEARAVIARARIKLAEVDAQIVECNAIWLDNDCWSRFFLVPAGHLHRDMHCSTCNNGHEPTTFGWLPQLSGLTEADAVAAHGALLCTVCYPSAPAEWTNGHETEAAAERAAECPGSRQYVKTERWDARYAKCPECGGTQSRTSTGKLRAHKPPTEKPAKKTPKVTAAPAPTDPAWDAMQSPELDGLLRTFAAAETALGTATDGPEFEAARDAYRALHAAAPDGWNSHRRARELGLNAR